MRLEVDAVEVGSGAIELGTIRPSTICDIWERLGWPRSANRGGQPA